MFVLAHGQDQQVVDEDGRSAEAVEHVERLRTINPDLAADPFCGYGGIVLRTTLNADQRAKVEATLQGAH